NDKMHDHGVKHVFGHTIKAGRGIEDGEEVLTILTSPEFFGPTAYRAKAKTPLEFVASALRATTADVTNVRALIGTIAAMGEPLYQSQPPTGYGDRALTWMNTGALIRRLNFAMSVAANGSNAAEVHVPRVDADLARFAAGLLADDLSPATRAVIETTGTP